MSPPRVGPANGQTPVIVRGAPFVFRTLHPLDGMLPRNGQHRANLAWGESTCDREQTFTMPAVGGLYHNELPSMEVIL